MLENHHVIKMVKMAPLNGDSTQYKLQRDWPEPIAYANSSILRVAE